MHVVSGLQIVSVINQRDYLVFSNIFWNYYMHYRFKRETFNIGFIKYINKSSMAAILDFTMAARDTNLKMCPVQLLTSKMYV